MGPPNATRRPGGGVSAVTSALGQEIVAEDAHRERIWFSPHCLRGSQTEQLEMFESAAMNIDQRVYRLTHNGNGALEQ
jgi:hypothetical protein